MGTPAAVPTRRGGGIQTITPGRKTNNTKRSRLLILKRWIMHHFHRKPVPQVTRLCRSDASVSIQIEGGIAEIQTATPGAKNNQPQTALPSDSKRTVQVHMPRSDVNVPVQAEGGSVEIQTLGANDNHYEIVLRPDLARAVDDSRPPSEADASGFQTVQVHISQSDASAPIEVVNGTVEFHIVAPGAQDHEDQPQIVQLPNFSAAENPPPPYEAVASSYQTVQVDLVPPFASLQIQADDGIVEFQTVTPRAQGHEEQPQIDVTPTSSSGLNNPPPPYEAVASGSQTFQVDMPPSYDEALHSDTIM